MEMRGVLEALAIAFSAQTLVALLGLYISYSLTALRKYHHTAKLAVRAACVTWLSELLALVFYSRFGQRGYLDEPELLVAAQALAAISDAMMVLLFLVLAKGWTIVRRKVSVQGRVKIACFMSSYLSISGATLVAYYTLYRFDERPSYYNSPAGLALVALRVLATG